MSKENSSDWDKDIVFLCIVTSFNEFRLPL